MLCPKCSAGNSKRSTECGQCGAALVSVPETSIYTSKERKVMHPSHEIWPGIGPVAKSTPTHVSAILADLKQKLGGQK